MKRRALVAFVLVASFAIGGHAAPSAQAHGHGHVKTMQLRWCPKC